MSFVALDSARCDVLAVARECVQAQGAMLQAMGVDAGIELPCGALPWLRLDQPRLRRLLEEALDALVRRAASRRVQLALWREATPEGPFRLRVEAYADDPDAGLSFELDVAGGQVAEPELPLGRPSGASRALLVEDHPARRRILQAQLARLGLASDLDDPEQPPAAASIAGRYGLVWLGAASGVDRIALVTSLRLLERRMGHARACVVSVRDAAACTSAGVDAWVEWPLSLEQLRRLCAGAPPDEEVAGDVFFREGRRDVAAIHAALRAGDWGTVGRHAHRIKGGTVVLGENDLCALAERIEEAARRRKPDPLLLARLLAELEDSLRRVSS